MSFTTPFVTIRTEAANEWTVVEKSFPHGGKWSISTASMEKTFTDEKAAEAAARAFAQLRKLFYVPADANVVTFALFLDLKFMIVELTPAGGVIGGERVPNIEQAISKCLEYAKSKNLPFIPPITR